MKEENVFVYSELQFRYFRNSGQNSGFWEKYHEIIRNRRRKKAEFSLFSAVFSGISRKKAELLLAVININKQN